MIEKTKLKRTGYFPAYFFGGLLGAAVPVMQMAVRAQIFTVQSQSPLNILLKGNWQMISMLNVLLAVCGACIMYHTEYAENALQKLESLPTRPYKMFLEKFLIAVFSSLSGLLLESFSFAFCIWYWFPQSKLPWMDILKHTGYELLLLLPTIILSLVIASIFRNMWVSLGIGIILVFTASMIPTDFFILSLFPFSLPYQILSTAQKSLTIRYLLISVGETAVFGAVQLLYLKIRRCFA